MRALTALLALSTCVTASAESGWFMPEVRYDEAGLPVAIAAPELGPEGLLAASCALTVEPAEADVAVTVTHGSDTLPFLDLAVTNNAAEDRTVSVALAIPVIPAADRAFLPAGERPRIALEEGAPAVTYSYMRGGTRLAMPLAQVYDATGDRGLAVCGDLGGLLVEPLQFELQRDAERTLLTLTWELKLHVQETVERRVCFAATQGDWRPALGAVLARFPAAFEAHSPDVDDLHGPFGGGGVKPDETLQAQYDQGCRAVEIHGWSPFYGRYVPVQERWTPFVDDRWHRLKERLPAEDRPTDDASWQEIRSFVEQRDAPTLSLPIMNDYISRLHAHGIKGLIYFNPTEAWAPWAAEQFPDDRRLDPDGNPIPVWYESSAMIPDKDRPWGKYLLEQVRGELEVFPEVDGVFFDQSAGGGHDLTELCAEACEMVRAQGKLCWWNGPYNMELAALADGMMTEGGGTERYRTLTEIIQYYAIGGKPIVSFGPWATPALCEVFDHAAYPSTPALQTDSRRDLHDRWGPLFLGLRNRRWVLEAHALKAPEDVSANIYRVRDGNLAVTLVPEPYRGDDAEQLWDVPVTVRVPEAAQVRGAYLYAPDLLGAHRLEFERAGEEIALRIPRLGPAALVVLATSGTWPSVDGPMHLVRGSLGPVRWRVDNWTADPQPVALAIDAPWGRAEAQETVAAGASAAVELPMDVPAELAGERVELALSATIADEERGGRAELWLDPPVMLSVQAPERIRDDEPLTLTARVLSHLPGEAELTVRAESDAVAFDPPERRVTLAPDEAVEVALTGTPTLAGDDRIVRVSVSGAGVEPTTMTQQIDVLATAIRADGFAKIRSAELMVDVFGVVHGRYKHKPISVNGVEIAVVPEGGGDRWFNGASVELPAEAVAALREHNELQIGNEPQDAFKVRNLRLLLHMPGAITVVSTTDSDVYTGWTDWLYGEGHQFPAGQPLTGITIDIPVDPNRRERYEEVFGTPVSGRLALEIAGSDGGAYAGKAVSVNGVPIGDLPGSASDWSERSMELPAEALTALSQQVRVVIENSNPPDAFKVRRARIEITNDAGERFATVTDEGAYTSVGWEFAEGVVGSPIRIELTFARE